MGFFDRVNVPELIAENDIAGLEKCLGSSDATIQFEAAEALAHLGNWKGYAFLVISTRNKKSSIRAAAAETLGSLVDPRAISLLVRLMNDDDEDVKQSAMDALRAINTSDSLNALAGFGSDTIQIPNNAGEGHTPNANVSDAIFGSVSQCDISDGLTGSIERQQSAEKHYILASKYYEEDRFTQALTEVNITLELMPEMAEASNVKGLILEALEDHYLSIVAYKKALKADPQSKDAQENLSALIVDLDISNTPFQEILDGCTSEDWEMRRDAIAALSVREEPEALIAIIDALNDEDLEVCSLALEALECSPSSAALEALQEYYHSFGSDDPEDDQEGALPSIHIDAIADPVQTLPEPQNIDIPEPRSAAEYIEDANDLVDQRAYSQAFVKCQLALLTDEYSADAYNLMGIIHEEKQEYRLAYYAYKNAISCDPAYQEAHNNLSELIREFGEANMNFHTLIADLETEEASLIYDAVVNLGELDNPDALEYLLPHLNHPGRSIALAVMESLGKLQAAEAVEDIAAAGAKFWHFPMSPVKMTLDQIEKALNTCLSDWSDRCKIILILGRLGAELHLTRTIEREILRLRLLSESFSEVGIEAFGESLQDTAQLAYLINQKYINK
jgi:HEAT repeat protein